MVTKSTKLMNKYLLFSFLSILLFCTGNVMAQVDLLRKIKDKAEDKVVEEIFKEDEDENKGASETSDTRTPQQSTSGSNRNTRGGGLEKSAPDVNQRIEDAQNAFDSQQYSNARYAVRQAIMGIELEIGENVLNSLPESVNNLEKIPESDNVTSTGIGFVGMTIERTYQKSDQELTVTIANDAGLLSATKMYITGNYATSTNEDEQYKRIQFQGNPAVIEYDDYEGYTLSVPFGQSSIFVVNGINYENEGEFMSSAEKFDIEKYKTVLGEK